MATDLTIAHELVAQHGKDRYTLKRKLKDRYDDLGPVLWALFRDGTLDVSADDGWWSDLDDCVDDFTAQDVADLLIAASKHPDMGGLRASWASEQDGWNIYTHCLVKAKVETDPAPLVAAYHAVPEPMKSPFGLELVAHGVLPVTELPDGALDVLARSAVQEVGSQSVADRILKAWPAAVAADALNRAASTPGARIWTLHFLERTAAHATADQLAGIAFDIDYRDAVPKMLELMDQHPKGLADAIRARRSTHTERKDFGVTTALGWLARAAARDGKAVADDEADELLAGLNADVGAEVVCEILAGVEAGRREAFVLAGLGDHRGRDALGWVPAALTDKTVQAAIDEVKGWKRGGYPPNGLERVFVAIGGFRPHALVKAWESKAAHRVWFVRGLAGTTDAAVLPGLVAMLGDSVEEVRDAAIAVLSSRPFAADAVAEARKSKKKDVRESAEKVAAALAEASAPKDPVQAMRDSVTEAEQEAFDAVWRKVRWYDADPVESAAGLDLAERAVAVTYDGLFRNAGTTTSKLAFWQAIAGRFPADAPLADLSIRMVGGFPYGDGDFDDSLVAHHRAIDGCYGWVASRFGAVARPAVVAILADPPSGWDRLVRFALDQGWSEVADVLLARIPTGDGDVLELALELLRDRAVPAVLDRLSGSKADDRALAADTLAAWPLASALPGLEAAYAKEKSAKARAALAQAAYAASKQADPDRPLDARMAAYPGPAEPGKLPILRWSGGADLSDGAFRWVLSRLAPLSPTADDDDLAEVRSALDPASGAALWSALEQTHAGTQPAKTGWVLMSAAVLGDESQVAALATGLDALTRGGGSAEAFARVEMLVRHGGSAALSALDEVGRTAKSQALKTRALDALDRAAERIGVPRDEIADRVAPTLGFDAAGARAFADGSTALVVRVGVGGTLEVEDPQGGKVTKLSKPGTKALGDLRKQVRAVVDRAAARLEQAMVTGRRLTADAFAATYASHPLLKLAAADVVWSLFDADGVRTGFSTTPRGTVGVAHPLELTDAERASFAGLRPLFPQLSRPVFAVPAAEVELKRIERYESAQVEVRRLRRVLEDRGWVRGEPQDAGAVLWYTKSFARAPVTAVIRLDPGFSVSDGDGGEQSLPIVELLPGQFARELPWHTAPVPPAEADGIVYSEVVADVEAMLGP